MPDIRIYLEIEPVAQPRQRHNKWGGNYIPKDHPVHAYKAQLQAAARLFYCGSPIEGPVKLDIDFCMPRPKRLLTPNSPMGRVYHDIRPDRDNLEKAAMDAIKGVIYHDDAQVCDGVPRKFYHSCDEMPHVLINVSELDSEVFPIRSMESASVQKARSRRKAA